MNGCAKNPGRLAGVNASPPAPPPPAILDRCPELRAVSGQVHAFATMFTQLTGQDLPQWIAGARELGLPGIGLLLR